MKGLKVCSRQFSNLSRFRWHGKSIETAYTPPGSWYTDPEFLNEVELKHTFRHWIYGTRLELLKDPGNYVAGNVNGEPFLIMHNKPTESSEANDNNKPNINAFYNVCRHHAAQLSDEGCGKLPANRITCPYHGWQYTLDGKLSKATFMKGCKNFKASDNGLIPIAMDTLGPWVFLKLGAEKGTQPTIFTDQPDMVKYHSLLLQKDYDKLVHVKNKKYKLKCNWKVFIDNYLDGGYHVPVVHKGLTSLLDMKTYKGYSSDNFYVQGALIEKDTNKVDMAVNDRLQDIETNENVLYMYHYPNFCVNRYGRWMDTNIVWPVGPNECIVEFDWYVEKSIAHDSEYINKCLADSEKIQDEDIWLCERVQKGLQSSAYNYGGRYSPSLEGGEFMFHQLLQRDVESAIERVEAQTNTSSGIGNNKKN